MTELNDYLKLLFARVADLYCPSCGAQVAPDDLLALCRGNIASFKIPRHVLFRKELPMTSSGKVQKFRLSELCVEELGLG